MTSIEEQLKNFLRPYAQLKLAILFGSLESGKAKPTSDMDLALLGNDILALNLTRAMQICVDIGSHIISSSDETAPQGSV